MTVGGFCRNAISESQLYLMQSALDKDQTKNTPQT